MAQPDDKTLIELGRLMFSMSQRPETRATVLKAVQKVDPKFQLPADVTARDVTDVIDEKFAERDTEARKHAVKAKLESDRKGLIDGTLLPGRKFDEDGVKKIEMFMQDRGYTDYRDAAILYGADEAPAGAVPEIPSAGVWEMPNVKNPFDSQALAKGATTKAYAAIAELRRGKAA